MIVCKKCGHHNEDNDTFCGSCGTFLEWTGERVVVEAELEPEPEPQVESEPTRPTLIDRVKHAVGMEEASLATPESPAYPPSPVAASAAPVSTAANAAPPPPAAMAAPQPAPAATAPPPPPPPAPPAPPPTPVMATSVAAQTVSPLRTVEVSSATPARATTPTVDEPISRKPESVLPAPPRRPVTRRQEAPTRRMPGDLICGQCGEGNDPSRHFCRRCGATLDEAALVRIPWYRRLWAAITRRKVREAGWRPRRAGGVSLFRAIWVVLRTVVVVAVILFLLLFALVPGFRATAQTRATSFVTTIWHRIHPTLSEVSLTTDTVSSAIPGHDGRAAIDQNLTTYWAAAPRDAKPVVHIQFSGYVDVAEFLVTPGPTGTTPADQFKAQPRPARIHLVFSNGQAVDVTAADEAALQHFALDVKHVNGVDIEILSIYPALPGSPTDSSVAITELEFQTLD